MAVSCEGTVGRVRVTRIGRLIGRLIAIDHLDSGVECYTNRVEVERGTLIKSSN